MENNKKADECLVHRYLYYIENEPVISDYKYDIMEKEALKTCDENHPLRKPGSSLKSSYSQDIVNKAKDLLNGK